MGENETVKVVALGTPKSGKTSYLATAYGEMDEGIDITSTEGEDVKLSLYCLDNDARNFLLDQHEHLQSGDEIEGTEETKVYTIEVSRKQKGILKNIANLEWMDFSGVDIWDNNKYGKDIEDAIKKTDCLLVFFNGKMFVDTNCDIELGNISGRMRNIFNVAQDRKRLSVAFVITNFDMCNIEDINKYYNAIYRNFENGLPGEKVKEELYETVNTAKVNFPIFTTSIVKKEQFEVRNIWKPLFYAVSSTLKFKSEMLKEEIEKNKDKIKLLQSKEEEKKNKRQDFVAKFEEVIGKITESISGTIDIGELEKQIQKLEEKIRFNGVVSNEIEKALENDEILGAEKKLEVAEYIHLLIGKYNDYIAMLDNFEGELENVQVGCLAEETSTSIHKILEEHLIYDFMEEELLERIKQMQEISYKLRKELVEEKRHSLARDILQDFELIKNDKRDYEFLVDINSELINVSMAVLKKEHDEYVNEIINWEKITDSLYGKNAKLMSTKMQLHYIQRSIRMDKAVTNQIMDTVYSEKQKRRIVEQWHRCWEKYCCFVLESNIEFDDSDVGRNIVQMYISGLNNIIETNQNLSEVLSKMESEMLAMGQRVERYIEEISNGKD